MTTRDMCTICGHDRFYHTKANGDCILGGILDAAHEFTGTSTVNWASEFYRHQHGVMRAPITYLSLDGHAKDENALANNGTWTANEGYTDGFDGSFQGAADITVNVDRIQLANAASHDFEHTDAFSISFWVFDATSNLTIGGGTSTNPFNQTGYGWRHLRNVGEFDFSLIDSANTRFSTATTGSAFPISTWTHVCMCYSGNSNQSGMKIYVNGVLRAQGTDSAISLSIKTGALLTFGASQTGVSGFVGQYDEIAVFDYELTAADVTRLFNAGNTLYMIRQPMTHIPVDTSEVADRRPQANNGTWTGTPTYSAGHDGTANGAINLDDGTKYVTLDNEANFDFDWDSLWSVSWWMKGVTPVGNRIVWSKGAAISAAGWYAFIRSNDRLRFRYTGTDLAIVSFDTTAPWNDDLWHYHTITYDGTRNRTGWLYYFDGVLFQTGLDFAFTANNLNANPFVFGADDGGGDAAEDTELDEMKVFNFVLSAAQIKTVFDGGDL